MNISTTSDGISKPQNAKCLYLFYFFPHFHSKILGFISIATPLLPLFTQCNDYKTIL